MSVKSLIINPGSTSTKIGVFEDENLLFEETLATAFWFSAWNTLVRGSSGTPEYLAMGISSSTTTGSTI